MDKKLRTEREELKIKIHKESERNKELHEGFVKQVDESIKSLVSHTDAAMKDLKLTAEKAIQDIKESRIIGIHRAQCKSKQVAEIMIPFGKKMDLKRMPHLNITYMFLEMSPKDRRELTSNLYEYRVMSLSENGFVIEFDNASEFDLTMVIHWAVEYLR